MRHDKACGTKPRLFSYAHAARVNSQYRGMTYRNFKGYETLGVDWENFSAWLREKRLVVIYGKSFTGKTMLANIMMMHVIAEFMDRFPLEESYQVFEQEDFSRYDDLLTFLDTDFAVFDRPDAMSPKMQRVLSRRYDHGLLSIVTAAPESVDWFTSEPSIQARYERARKISLV